jgi:hypothetical protein
MKVANRLLLGTAAGLMALSAAPAADMPLKAKPVQYVKICTLYGDGYYYIPGTDTCIRIGGYVREDLAWNARSTACLAPPLRRKGPPIIFCESASADFVCLKSSRPALG